MKKSFIFLLFSLIIIAGSCKKKPQEQPQEEPAKPVDAAVMSIDLPTFTTVGQQVEIKGKIQNLADGTIKSFDLKWQADNGTVHTQHVDDLNMQNLDVYEYNHPDKYTPQTTGNHIIKVWVENINGQAQDERPGNDRQEKNLIVASQTVQRTVLYEEFTSSTCSPCANFNTNYFNTSFLQQNQGKYTLIKYQMNWPGNGDPYYTAEGGTRRQYYGVNGVPTLYMDGREGTHFDTSQLQSALDDEYAQPAVCSLQAYYHIYPDHTVKVKVTGTPYISENVTLHVAVVEKTTTGNASSNGETEFHNVMMKMVPDANGTSFSITDGTSFTKRIQASMNNTHVEEWTDLAVVVFLQVGNTKVVLQSSYAVDDETQIDF